MQTLLQERKESILKTNAFYWVSFNPHERLKRYAQDFEIEQNEIKNLCEKYGVDSERILKKHYDLTMKYLCAESRCASAAITGPAKFPVAKMEKRNNIAHNHLQKLCDYTKNIEKLLIRITRAKKTEAEKIQEWEKQVEALKARHEIMKKYNKGVLSYDELPPDMKKHIDFIKRNYPQLKANFTGYKLTNNLANIKRLENQILLAQRTKETKKDTGFNFNGGHVSFDDVEIRYNIYFDNIPDVEIRTKLKQNGFKWSPKRKAWTRGAKTISIDKIKSILI